MKPLDCDTAWAAAQEAGNRHAQAHGRTTWNEDDYDYAAEELDRLLEE